MVRYFFCAMLILLSLTGTAQAQPALPIEGSWSGTLDTGGAKLRLIFQIRKEAQGGYSGTLTSVDQGNVSIPIDSVAFQEGKIIMIVATAGGEYQAVMSPDGTSLKGTWMQGDYFPLELARDAANARVPSAPAK